MYSWIHSLIQQKHAATPEPMVIWKLASLIFDWVFIDFFIDFLLIFLLIFFGIFFCDLILIFE